MQLQGSSNRSYSAERSLLSALIGACLRNRSRWGEVSTYHRHGRLGRRRRWLRDPLCSRLSSTRSAYMPFQEERLFLLGFIEKHIVEGNDHIAAMRRLIADGERQQFDMSEAKLQLAEFLTAQVQREAHREQVLQETR